MKELYELLNDVQIDLDDYDNSKLSEVENKRIKDNLLDELASKRKGKKIKKLSFAKAGACAAFVLCVGSITVAAATGVLTGGIKSLFKIDSEKKVQVANEMGSSVGMCAEDNGIKITAEGVLRDSQHISVVYTIERTDQSALDENGSKCVNVEFGDFECEDSSRETCYSGEAGTMNQKFDSKSIMCYTIYNCNQKFDKTLDIKLSDIRLWFENTKEVEDSCVEIEGDWKFSIPTDFEDCSMNLANGQELEMAGQKANLEQLTISPMGYYFELTSKEEFDDNKIIQEIESGSVNLHLKNGTIIPFDGSCGPKINKDGTWSYHINGTFDKLILFEEMDKVTVGEYEYKIK